MTGLAEWMIQVWRDYASLRPTEQIGWALTIALPAIGAVVGFLWKYRLPSKASNFEQALDRATFKVIHAQATEH